MMRKARAVIFLLCILLLTAAARAQSGQAVGSGRGCTEASDRADLEDCCPGRACVRTVQFKSQLVNATLPYRVIVPTYYTSAGREQQSYPVLYLLHGLTGHYDNWAAKTKLIEYASAYRFIIVMPEGNNGWYTDSASVSTDKYESYILQELIPEVQRRFRTIESREGRAVAGLSMGGYGALKFGLKHPQTFAFAASISGALGVGAWTESDLRPYGAELARSVMEIFGPMGSETRAANDLTKLVRSFPSARLKELPYFYLDCGTEDGLLPFNRALTDLFLERKIPHEYRQLPGTHNWAYWDAQVREVLRIAAQKIPLARLSANARP